MGGRRSPPPIIGLRSDYCMSVLNAVISPLCRKESHLLKPSFGGFKRILQMVIRKDNPYRVSADLVNVHHLFQHATAKCLRSACEIALPRYGSTSGIWIHEAQKNAGFDVRS